MTMVLHTWGQKLIDHYHLHVLVTGGGLTLDGTHWIPTTEFYLFPVRALAKVFRAKFCEGLQRLFADDPPPAPSAHPLRCPQCGANALVLVEIVSPPKTLRPEDTS